MIWTILFLVSIAQALFLISVLLIRKSNNKLGRTFLIAMISTMILVNMDFLIVASGIYKQHAELFGISFGTLFLFGPLFYLYSKSILSSGFKWKGIYLLHFLPYIFKVLFASSFLFLPNEIKIYVIDEFLNYKSVLAKGDLILILVQIFHLAVYLFLTHKIITRNSNDLRNERYLISMSSRNSWTKSLFVAFVAFLISYSGWCTVLIFSGIYIPAADYTNVMITSFIVYFIAFKAVLHPEIIDPGFQQKYSAVTLLSDEENAEIIQKLRFLMEVEKVFLDPSLDLNSLAKKINISSHQLSKIINSQFGKTFFEFLNYYRIEEVKARLNLPAYTSFSILGIALDVGFNSKSAFNNAFKRCTGLTPSEFKRGSAL